MPSEESVPATLSPEAQLIYDRLIQAHHCLSPELPWELPIDVHLSKEQSDFISETRNNGGFGLDETGSVVTKREIAKWWTSIQGIVAVPSQEILAIHLVRVIHDQPEEQVELISLNELLEYRLQRTMYHIKTEVYLEVGSGGKLSDPDAPKAPAAPHWILLRRGIFHGPEVSEDCWGNRDYLNGPTSRSTMLFLFETGQPEERSIASKLDLIVGMSYLQQHKNHFS